MTNLNNPTPSTWEQCTIAALRELGGEAHLSDLYDQVEALRKRLGLPLSATFKATIRRTVQQSKLIEQDDKQHKSGIWRLVNMDVDRYWDIVEEARHGLRYNEFITCLKRHLEDLTELELFMFGAIALSLYMKTEGVFEKFLYSRNFTDSNVMCARSWILTTNRKDFELAITTPKLLKYELHHENSYPENFRSVVDEVYKERFGVNLWPEMVDLSRKIEKYVMNQ